MVMEHHVSHHHKHNDKTLMVTDMVTVLVHVNTPLPLLLYFNLLCWTS